MSHLKERKEKNCLNCNAVVQGRFCHVCGQENIEPKETFWHLTTHFIYDIIHFDGKFFNTLKFLLFKPGFLSVEYIRGKRASYLHPIRMYVFTSAFFFLILFSFYKGEEDIIKVNGTKETAATMLNKLITKKEKLQKVSSYFINDSLKQLYKKKILDLDSDITLLTKDTTAIDKLKTINQYEDIIHIGSKVYANEEEYALVQSKLPANKRDDFIKERLIRQNFHIREKYHNNLEEIKEAFFEKFKHTIPQMLFIGLPIFALLLLLFYRKLDYYFVNHVVFLIHLFCATFIIVLFGFWFSSLLSLLHINDGWISTAFFFLILFYWYKSMRNFYKQRRAKTILKYSLFLFCSSIIMTLLFVVFLMFSVMTI